MDKESNPMLLCNPGNVGRNGVNMKKNVEEGLMMASAE
jgi:hypothetical protein